jgi:poly-gamma-glutamate capsule biosynthesis protein CapA/YwtB (metallophosphatase superfamily)
VGFNRAESGGRSAGPAGAGSGLDQANIPIPAIRKGAGNVQVLITIQ